MLSCPALSPRPGFTPWDLEVARINFGANCGPASFAAITGFEVCRVMCHFAHFEHSRWTNLTQMRHALCKTGHRISVLKGVLPTRGVALIQWLGPWTKDNRYSRWSLPHTHWIAIQGQWVFDHTVGDWEPLGRWQYDTVRDFISQIPHAYGWAVRHGIEVVSTNSICFGSDGDTACSSCQMELSLSS